MRAYVRRRIERANMIREWREHVEKIARSARNVLGDVEIYVFGSAAEGKLTASSDIDLLIVYEGAPEDFEAYENLKERILRGAGLDIRSPFQLHIVDRDGAKFYLENLGVRAKKILSKNSTSMTRPRD